MTGFCGWEEAELQQLLSLGRESEEDGEMSSILTSVAHRPHPLPSGQWRLTQRWNDLLFAHWPIPVEEMAALLPDALEVDTFDGWAWVGVVPFWMDRVKTRVAGDMALGMPGASSFPELNVRTYVRSKATGLPAVFFFALDAASPLAVVGARTLFSLPYFWADMARETTASGVEYSSRRLLTRTPARFEASYRPVGPVMAPSRPGSLEYFLTERYALLTLRGGRLAAGHIQHLPWPLQPAEADIRVNSIAAAHGIGLPGRAPVLHYVHALEVFLWGLGADRDDWRTGA
jgi:uncharacterized protein YqjF (DUF2071 family)